METRTEGDKLMSVTCPTCDHTVGQNPGSNRLICPRCGNFYSREAAENARHSRRLGREQQGRQNISDAQDQDKPAGTLRESIANFFQNLGPKGKNKVTTRSRSESDETPMGRRSSTSTTPGLPPISNSQTPSGNRPNNYLSVQSGAPSPMCSPRGSRPPSGRSNKSQILDPGGRINTWSQQGEKKNTQISASPMQNKLVYPVRTKTADQIREEVRSASETGNWKVVQDFYSTVFDSFLEINATFKRDPSKEYKTVEEPGLKFELVNTMYELLPDLPQEIQKVVLKAIINSLLKDKRPHTKDDLRAYMVLIQNPQFEKDTTYVIFAHLLRQIAALTDHDHHFLVHWMRRVKTNIFLGIIKRLQNFISIRLFPPKPQDLPPIAKCTWWIPSATKVLALLSKNFKLIVAKEFLFSHCGLGYPWKRWEKISLSYPYGEYIFLTDAANNMAAPNIVHYSEFYNSTLDHLDLMAEYYTWQNPSSCAGFSFCQYPFILSISAKRSILQKDSEQQMIIMARRSLVAKVQRRQLPDVGMLFLNLTVRRSHLVSDSLNEIARKQHDLKKKLKVTFAGEPGLDMGGLTKEWFLLLIRQIFHSDYGMFTYNKKAGVHWFSTSHCESFQEFNLVGVVSFVCYKKLLSPAVVPYNNPRATVGVMPVTLEDLKTVQPDVASGLQNLLEYDGDVEDDFGLTFQVSQTDFGILKTVDLKPKGADIPVNNENRKEYVQLYVDWVMNKSIYQQFQAFYHGFHSVCASNALIMLRPQEVEMLVCGSPTIDMNELRKVTSYDGYNSQDPTIKCFWEVLGNLPMEFQKKFLLFSTGSDRIPIGGMAEMTFKITRVGGTELLPMAHTCFNQLVLPAYRSKKILKQKLLSAIQNSEGFGLE
ncbi:hypothetical protein FSP39_024931 [Pinctada imbricata]|uniref:HECT-type E3 ubiquitin transferase n=1 Tax=Pinctada imbricata TaxID=66713 RepID=A0AA88Y0Y6_PINIB|nr:hypothetical protein FSP39_024931 [Pinctada imbricata]